MKTLNKEYIGGLLETNGGWFLGREKYLMFKLTTNKHQLFIAVFKWLNEHYNIEYGIYNNVFQVINRKSVHNMISFMKLYTNRQDYKKYTDNPSVVVCDDFSNKKQKKKLKGDIK